MLKSIKEDGTKCFDTFWTFPVDSVPECPKRRVFCRFDPVRWLQETGDSDFFSIGIKFNKIGLVSYKNFRF